MAEVFAQLEPGKFYHIYNHATGKENLFENDTDYRWFLNKVKKYIVPVSDIYAYCLMPNHFHLVVRIKSEDEVNRIINEKIKKPFNINGVINQQGNNLCHSLSQLYSNFFNAYSKYYNFWKKRRGTLFQRAFRRKLIEDNDYLKQVICYLHQNPITAGFCQRPDEWKYSSYNALVSKRESLLSKIEVIALFDDEANFVFCNAKPVELDFD